MTPLYLGVSILLCLCISHAYGRLSNSGSTQCPPSNFDSKASLNITAFFSGTWYSIKQLEQSYQKLDEFYCTSATYTLETETRWWCKLFNHCNEQSVKVQNRATKGLNGCVNEATLREIPDQESSSKAKVRPFFPAFLGP